MRPAAYGVRGKVPSLFQERMLFVHAWFMTGRHAPSFQSAFLIVLFSFAVAFSLVFLDFPVLCFVFLCAPFC